MTEIAASSKPASTEEYLATLDAGQQEAIRALRRAILEAVPEAAEAFTYGIPAFKFQGRSLAWCAAWKQHYSLYPITEGMRAAAGNDLQRYQLSKGTIRFPASEPLPLDLVQRMVRARAAEIRETGH